MSTAPHRLVPTLCLLFGLIHTEARAHVLVFHDVEDGQDWCDVVQHAAANGDVVRLAAGDYDGDCLIMKSGIPAEGEPIAIVARGDGPVRIHGRPGRPVITVIGNYVRLGGLHLIPAPGEGAVLGRGRSLLVDGCTFEGGTFGLDLRETRGGISLIGNTFEDTARPIDFGCEAAACDRVRAVLRGNLVRSATSHAGPAVAVTAPQEILFEDNVIEGRWEIGALLDGPAVVARSVVLGGERGMALREGRVVNSIIAGTTVAGIALTSAPGTLRVDASTLVPAGGLAVDAPEGRSDFEANAVWSDDPADDSLGVRCSDERPCWVAPEAGDLRPLEALAGTGPRAATARRDLCGLRRPDADAAGALALGHPLPKRLQPVALAPSGCLDASFIDPGLEARPPPAPDEIAVTGGCAGSPHGLPWAILLALGAARRWRTSHR